MLFILLSIYIIFRICLDNKESIYDINDNKFTMIVDSFNIEGNKLSLTLNGKEDLVGSYYIDTYDELLYLIDNIKYGVSINVEGSLKIPSNNTIPNTFNYKKYLNNKDIYYSLDISKIEILDNDMGFIYKLKNLINDRITKIDDTGYMKAFILGDKNNIDSDIYNSFQKIGVTHLFALSGMHVGLLSGIILKLLKKFNDKSKYLIISIILIIYGFIVGYPSSIKRCILFFLFNTINKLFKLEISSFKVLLLVVVSLILYNYKIIYDVGFIYSVCTVMGIILCNSFINHDNKLISSFRLSLVAFIFSLPISLCNFYEINILSIIYNIVFVPFVSVIVYPLSLLSFIIPSIYFIFEFFIKILEVSSTFLSNIRFFNIYMNFNMFEVILFYLFSLLVFYKGIYKLGLCLVLIIIIDFIIPYFDSNGYVYFFDVGQGDSSLIISPYRKDIVLIDTGGSINYVKEEWMKKEPYYVSDNVISFMKSIGIKSIDLLILSHGDADHANEVDNILKDIDIKCLNINLGDINRLESNSLSKIEKCLYKPKNMVLNYLNYKEYDNENDNSLLTYMNIYDTSIVSFGDASYKVEEDIINKYNLSNIDILKVSHHGSKTSSSKKYIDEINPKYSVISVGKNNRFGHPNEEVLDNLKESTIYRTDIDGTVIFEIKYNSIKIETFNS